MPGSRQTTRKSQNINQNINTGRGIMAEETRDRFEVPKDMRSMAEASVEQARKTFERFLDSAQTTAGTLEERGATVRAGAKDIGAKAIAYAEKNVHASLDYAQSLLHAKDLTEVMRLHSEFVQAQMRNLAEQANEMGQIVSRAAIDAAKPKN
jgi:phasin